MNKKLYVGSLPYAVDDEELKNIFSKFGTVDTAKVISDKLSGRSKGFGSVEMSTAEEAQAAMTALNGSKQGERNLIVSEARPESNTGGERRRGGFGGGHRS
jgi:RNA recognition motif-containing protein